MSQAYPHEPMLASSRTIRARRCVHALCDAEIRVEQSYTTPTSSHQTDGRHTRRVAAWDDDGRLTVYDTTQGVQ